MSILPFAGDILGLLPTGDNNNTMKLIGSHASPYTRKVRIVAAEKRIELEFAVENPWSPTTSVPAQNPLGKVPVLVLDDGSTLFDSRVIVEYLDNISPVAKLIPLANRERTEVRRWEALADGVLDAGVAVRLENQRDPGLRSAPWIERQTSKITGGLALMEQELAGGNWCAGHAFSLADVAVGACLFWLDYRHPSIDWRARCPGLARHAAKLAERASFAETPPRD
jgi:glutathione S-transferase